MKSCPKNIEATAPPGTWAPVLHDDKFTATLTCPKCGAKCSLRDHTIDVFGFVTTIVSHQPCGWQDRVVLQEWRG